MGSAGFGRVLVLLPVLCLAAVPVARAVTPVVAAAPCAVAPGASPAVEDMLAEMILLVEGKGPTVKDMSLADRSARFVQLRDLTVRELRVPGDFPSGFMYGRLERVVGSYATLADATVREPYAAGAEGEIVEARVDLAYEVNLYVPSKRGLFEGNSDAYLVSVTYTYEDGGRRRLVQVPVNRWIRRGSNHPVPFPAMLQNVDVEARVLTKPGREGRTTVRLQAALPTVVDDESNPNYQAILTLTALPTVFPESHDERGKLLSVLHELARTVSPYSVGSQERYELRRKLEYVEYLMGGREDDVLRAREELRAIIRALREGMTR